MPLFAELPRRLLLGNRKDARASRKRGRVSLHSVVRVPRVLSPLFGGRSTFRPRHLLRFLYSIQPLLFTLECPEYGADGLKYALVLLHEQRDEFPTATLIIACHDEIVYECDEGEGPAVQEWLERSWSGL